MIVRSLTYMFIWRCNGIWSMISTIMPPHNMHEWQEAQLWDRGSDASDAILLVIMILGSLCTGSWEFKKQLIASWLQGPTRPVWTLMWSLELVDDHLIVGGIRTALALEPQHHPNVLSAGRDCTKDLNCEAVTASLRLGDQEHFGAWAGEQSLSADPG